MSPTLERDDGLMSTLSVELNTDDSTNAVKQIRIFQEKRKIV